MESSRPNERKFPSCTDVACPALALTKLRSRDFDRDEIYHPSKVAAAGVVIACWVRFSSSISSE